MFVVVVSIVFKESLNLYYSMRSVGASVLNTFTLLYFTVTFSEHALDLYTPRFVLLHVNRSSTFFFILVFCKAIRIDIHLVNITYTFYLDIFCIWILFVKYLGIMIQYIVLTV